MSTSIDSKVKMEYDDAYKHEREALKTSLDEVGAMLTVEIEKNMKFCEMCTCGAADKEAKLSMPDLLVRRENADSLKEENTLLQSEIGELRQKNVELTEQLEATGDDNVDEDAHNKLVKQNDEIHALNHKILKLELENKRLKLLEKKLPQGLKLQTENEQLIKKLKLSEDSLKKLVTQLRSKLTEDSVKLKSDMAQLNSWIVTSFDNCKNDQKEFLNAELSNSEKMNDLFERLNVSTPVTVLETQLKAMVARADSVQADKTDLEGRVKEISDKSVRTQARLEKELNSANAEIKKLDRSNLKLEKKLKLRKESKRAMESELNEFKKTKLALKEEIADLQSQNEQKEATIADISNKLKEQLTPITDDPSKCPEDGEIPDDTIDQVPHALAGTSSSSSYAKTPSQKLVYDSLCKQNDNTKGMLQRLIDALRVCTTERTQLKSVNAQLSDVVEQSKKRCEDLEDQINGLNESMSKHENEKIHHTKIKSEKERQDRQIETLQQQLSDSQANLSRSGVKNQILEGQISKFENRWVSSDLDMVIKRNTELKKQNAELEKKLKEAKDAADKEHSIALTLKTDELKEMADSMTKLKSDLQSNNEQLDRIKDEKRKLMLKISSTEKQLSDHKFTNKKVFDEKEKEISRLNDQVAKHTENMTLLKRQHQEKIINDKSKFDELLKLANDRTNIKSNQLSEARQAMDSLKTENNNINSTIVANKLSIEKTIKDSEQQRLVSEKRIEQLNAEVSKLTSDLKKKQVEYNELVRSNKEKVICLERELNLQSEAMEKKFSPVEKAIKEGRIHITGSKNEPLKSARRLNSCDLTSTSVSAIPVVTHGTTQTIETRPGPIEGYLSLQEHQDEIECLKEQLTQKNKELQALTNEFTQYKESTDGPTTSGQLGNKRLRDQISRVSGDVTVWQSNTERLKRDLDASEKEIAKLKESQEDSQRYRESTANVEKKFKDLQNEHNNLVKEYTRHHKEVQRLRKDMSANNGQKLFELRGDKMRETVNVLSKDLTKIHARNEKLERKSAICIMDCHRVFESFIETSEEALSKCNVSPPRSSPSPNCPTNSSPSNSPARQSTSNEAANRAPPSKKSRHAPSSGGGGGGASNNTKFA